MIQERIKYTDYNGVEKERTITLGLTQAKIIELNAEREGGLDAYYQRIVDTKDSVALMKELKKLLLLGYGEFSDDGEEFRQSAEISEHFSNTIPYDVMFMRMYKDPEYAAKIFNGLLPTYNDDPNVDSQGIR